MTLRTSTCVGLLFLHIAAPCSIFALRVLIGILLLIGCLLHLVVLFVMRFLVLLGLVLVFLLACMLITGGTGVAGILMILVLLLTVCPLHVWVLVVCLVLYRLSRGLSSGVWCLPCRLRMLFTWVLIISTTLFGMFLVLWMVTLVVRLLSLLLMEICSLLLRG